MFPRALLCAEARGVPQADAIRSWTPYPYSRVGKVSSLRLALDDSAIQERVGTKVAGWVPVPASRKLFSLIRLITALGR